MVNRYKPKNRPYRKYQHNVYPADRDNKGYYAGWKSGHEWSTPENSPIVIPASEICVPSKKRGKSTWKRFYRLFPHLKYRDKFKGVELKKI